MLETSVQRIRSKPEVKGYSTSWEHLSDELRCLDIHLHLKVLLQPHAESSDPLAPFTGLVLTETEILALLAGETSIGGQSVVTATAQQRTLVQAARSLEKEIAESRAASLKAGSVLALPQLAHLFHLTRFEERCLLVCLAPELARKYERIYAYLQDDATRKKPTVDLVLDLLCSNAEDKLAARGVFFPQSPLLKYRLCEMEESSQDGRLPFPSRSLKLDDRIANFLLGFGDMDSRLKSFARLASPQSTGNPSVSDEQIYSRTLGVVKTHFGAPPQIRRNLILHFFGPAGTGKQSVAEAATHEIGLPLLIGDVEQMLASPDSFEENIWLLAREALLQPAALFLENMDCLLVEPDKNRSRIKVLLETIRTFSALTFIASTCPWLPPRKLHEQQFISVELKLPDPGATKELWENHLKACVRLGDDVEPGGLASRFRFGPGMIKDSLLRAEDHAYWRSPEDARITAADLFRACRAQATPKLGTLAQKIEPKYTWQEIVLPEDQLAQLRELCNQAKYRHIVYGDWGFDRKLSLGKGLNALFSGPPGTGKTMAAEVIANELQLDLFKIDLSQVVSKYIGETEKNLHNIFNEAQASSAILFFDEADALFGKRSQIKDAHDRYANIEVGYLLQKMEEYEGISILATNLRAHLDEAFVRRMHFIVEFPFPDEEYRRRIWEVIFPREAPLGTDVDFGVLAREVKLAGGNIKNIGLASAFYAAGDGGVIGMSHLARAARREFQKLGRSWGDAGGIITDEILSRRQ